MLKKHYFYLLEIGSCCFRLCIYNFSQSSQLLHNFVFPQVFAALYENSFAQREGKLLNLGVFSSMSNAAGFLCKGLNQFLGRFRRRFLQLLRELGVEFGSLQY